MPPHEKRASTRYDVEIDMQLSRNGDEIPATSVNLSLGGALIKVPASAGIKVAQRVEVAFRVPDLDKPLNAKAEVRWVNDVNREIVGIQFVTGFRAKETWALGRFLERQKPT